jgi:hypothetical protein
LDQAGIILDFMFKLARLTLTNIERT